MTLFDLIGTITDKYTGAGIDGVSVMVIDVNEVYYAITSAGGGKYGFANLPVGQFYIEFSKSGYVTQTWNVYPDVLPTFMFNCILVPVSPPPFELDVRVLDCDTGQPVSGATVEFTDGVVYSKATDAQGFAIFTELPPNTTFILKVYRTTYDSFQENYTTPPSGVCEYKQVNLCRQHLGTLSWSYTATSMVGGDWVEVFYNSCRPDGWCGIYICAAGRPCQNINYWQNENPYVWYKRNGVWIGAVGSYLKISGLSAGESVEIYGLMQPPTTYRRVDVTVKNKGGRYNFGMNLKIYQVISPILSGCDATGSGLIYETQKTYFTLESGQTTTVSYEIPLQYAKGYIIAKVYDDGNCLDGDFAYF